MPLRTRRSLTLGTPRGLFGRNGLMAVHSKSVSSYLMIRGPRFGSLNHAYLPVCNAVLQVRDGPDIGHAADTSKTTLMTHSRHSDVQSSQFALPGVPVLLEIEYKLVAKTTERLLECVCCQVSPEGFQRLGLLA